MKNIAILFELGLLFFFASFIYYSRKIIIQNAGHRCIRNNVPHKIITKLKNLRSDAWLCVCVRTGSHSMKIMKSVQKMSHELNKYRHVNYKIKTHVIDGNNNIVKKEPAHNSLAH